MSLINNLKKRGFKDILNPRKWKIFARYMAHTALNTEYPELDVPEYQEQIAIRMAHPGCRACIKSGECVHCGCKSPELFLDKTNECSGGHWFTMIDPEQWPEFKKKAGIEPDPFYLEQVIKLGKVVKFKEDGA